MQHITLNSENGGGIGYYPYVDYNEEFNIVKCLKEPPKLDYFWIENLTNENNVFKFINDNDGGGWSPNISISYSLDNGVTWNDISDWSIEYEVDGHTEYGSNEIIIPPKGILYLKGDNNSFSRFDWMHDAAAWHSIRCSTSYKVGGKIISLLSTTFDDNVIYGKETVLLGLFSFSKTLIDASELIFPNIVSCKCYQSMFSGCTSLIKAPELPATTLADDCYYSMFQGCTSLTQAPELPATTLANYCYSNMFNGCAKLNYIKALFTDKSATNCLYDWLRNASLTGTFVKNPSTNWTNLDLDLPSGWTIIGNI